MKNPVQISSLINCLTNDEDLRQELWVHYLSGNPIESFASHLEKLNLEYSEDSQLKAAVWQMMLNPPSERFLQMLSEHFTEFERTIIVFLALGLSVEKIAAFKGISQVRIRQTISSIRYNGVWNTYETLHKMSKREERS